MNITDIRIRRTYQEGRLRALVSLTLDNDFAVHDVKVIEGPQRLFVAMPSRKDENGVFRDIVHPITAEARGIIENAILDAYSGYLSEQSNTIDPGGASGAIDDAHEDTNAAENYMEQIR